MLLTSGIATATTTLRLHTNIKLCFTCRIIMTQVNSFTYAYGCSQGSKNITFKMYEKLENIKYIMYAQS